MRHVFALGVLLMFGCSSVDDSAPAVSADKACTDLAAAYCEKANSCASDFVKLEYGDVATCSTRFKTSCLTGLSAPSVGTTPSDTAACATAAKSLTCTALFDNQTPTECLPKAGGLDDGKPCHSDSQCKSAFCSVDDARATCGVCAAKPAAGGSCKTNSCPSGLKCSDNGTCNAPVPIGGTCSESIPCASGGSCFGGKCVADAATEGAACHEMNGPSCDGTKGLFCLARKCVKVTVVAAGAACGFDYDTATMTVKSAKLCEKAGWCKGVDLTAMPPVFMGKCEPAAADGQPCIADTAYNKGPGCMEPAECVSGKCQLADNATCK
jgi:hypothetical protein